MELAHLFDMTVSELVEPGKCPPSDPAAAKTTWRLGFERFAVIAYSAAAILSTIETSDLVFPVFTTILILIPSVIMAISIMRLPPEIRRKTAVRELCCCIVVYCIVAFLESVIRNVFASIIILICCVVNVWYIRFK